MKRLNDYRMKLALVGCVIALFALNPAAIRAQDGGPIADAGSSRYAGPDPIVLDGTASYDPDNSGTLSYTWRQISGPSVVIIDANTPTPTIAGSLQPDKGRGVDPTPKPQGFLQTYEIQECEFELIVRSAECESEPDIVKVVIVPMFPPNNMIVLENDFFDPNKPTFIWFEGAYSASNLCTGGGPWNIGSFENNQLWKEQANVISFSPYYADPGSTCGWNSGPNLTFSRCADIIIVYLSDVAPNYHQSIQTAGLSLGGIPAIDVALRLNQTYADARYAVNHVSFLDATSSVLGYAEYSKRVASFLDNPVDDEQCWFDSYVSAYGGFYPSALNVSFTTQDHFLAADWYHASLTTPESCDFNGGIVAGAYWSVIGPGKNLQLASTPGTEMYKFTWHGNERSGNIDFYNESNHPGRLPEPVTLAAWRDSLDPNGVVFTCKESENAVGYELLFGPDPYRVMDYIIVSDAPIPPCEVISNFPFEETWWTIRARDQYGSIIYTDPMRLDLENLPWPTIENLTTGQTYGYIQVAIDHATPGDEIVISPGTYHENITVEGENLTITSVNPNDPTVVAATIINGADQRPLVTFTRGQSAGCVLAGLTINGGTVGISCGDASPMIRNCTIESTGPIAIEFLYGYEPTIIDCTILGSIMEVYVGGLLALWNLDETEGDIAYDSIGNNDGICHGSPLWQPVSGMLAGALKCDGIDDYISTDFVLSPTDGKFGVLAWIKGGAPGQVIVSQEGAMNWLMADITNGVLKTDLRTPEVTGRDGKPAGPPLISSTVVTDGDWHRVGLVRDGINRILYVDDVEVASDTAETLGPASGGLHFGVGSTLTPGTFFSGLIDDVRIYNRAVSP